MTKKQIIENQNLIFKDYICDDFSVEYDDWAEHFCITYDSGNIKAALRHRAVDLDHLEGKSLEEIILFIHSWLRATNVFTPNERIIKDILE